MRKCCQVYSLDGETVEICVLTCGAGGCLLTTHVQVPICGCSYMELGLGLVLGFLLTLYVLHALDGHFYVIG